MLSILPIGTPSSQRGFVRAPPPSSYGARGPSVLLQQRSRRCHYDVRVVVETDAPFLKRKGAFAFPCRIDIVLGVAYFGVGIGPFVNTERLGLDAWCSGLDVDRGHWRQNPSNGMGAGAVAALASVSTDVRGCSGVGNATPRCSYAMSRATRPRRVRPIRPTRIMNGS